MGAAYEYMNGGDNNIDVERGPLAGRLEGDYKSFDFHFFALNLIWRFGGDWRLNRPAPGAPNAFEIPSTNLSGSRRQTHARGRTRGWTSATP